jgi:hypothetical protein
VVPDLERFLALVRRELGAHEVSVCRPEEAPPAADEACEMRSAIPDGRIVVATFAEAPAERDAKQRRLDMLASTFDALAEEAPGPRSRPPAGVTLQDELKALCERAAAINVLVIDANSPILWGAARPRGVAPDEWTASAVPTTEGTPADSAEDESVAAASRTALQAVRELVELSALRKGKRVRHVERDGTAPFLVQSFAGIYLLTLVFAAEFDELRAERGVLESIGRIERLVLALPPTDPSPEKGAGVISIRRGQRRS